MPEESDLSMSSKNYMHQRDTAKEGQRRAGDNNAELWCFRLRPVVLAMLLEDDDRDIRFFAEKTETALNNYFSSMATSI
jgi:hypothetical protein